MDSARGRLDMVLAKALDRISRDQEDIADIYKRMLYADVKMFTLSEGEISELHVGLKGTMNALFLKDLADKTRRGQRGRVEAGKSGGGSSYGYDVVKKFDGNGEAVRGDRTINPVQAEVVLRIFRDYAAGKSAKRIAFDLNREGIEAPPGGDWGFSTINGNQKRGSGILNNEMYVGKLVWSLSTQTRPSGFSITSMTSGSSRKAEMAGPSAVRSIRAPRLAVACLSSKPAIPSPFHRGGEWLSPDGDD